MFCFFRIKSERWSPWVFWRGAIPLLLFFLVLRCCCSWRHKLAEFFVASAELAARIRDWVDSRIGPRKGCNYDRLLKKTNPVANVILRKEVRSNTLFWAANFSETRKCHFSNTDLWWFGVHFDLWDQTTFDKGQLQRQEHGWNKKTSVSRGLVVVISKKCNRRNQFRDLYRYLFQWPKIRAGVGGPI